MGKFAGFLKRAKKIAGFAGGILNGLNKLYKGVKPYAENIISSYVPGGEIINKGLNFASNVIDNIHPITKKWLEEDEKEKLKSISNNIKRYGGDVAQKALNNYLDQQDELFSKRGNYTFNDYASRTAGDFATGMIKSAGSFGKNNNGSFGSSIFGKPLNATTSMKVH